MLLGPNHVGDSHVVIVDHHRKVVRRKTIGTDEDEVAQRFLLPGHFAANEIVDRDIAVVGNVKSDRVWRVVIAAVEPAFEIVVWRTTLLLRLLALFLQLLFRAVAAIRDAAREQLLRNFVIEPGALGLPEWSLIPLQSEPAEIFEDHLFRFAGRARDIGVLDAKNERAFVMLREQPVEDRSASAAAMKMARR